jgi:hypothetical protein
VSIVERGTIAVRLAVGSAAGQNVSDAWLQTVRMLDATSDRRCFHLMTHIARPTDEDPLIRAAADDLQRDLGCYPIDTVANTIFPAALAEQSDDERELTSRYKALFPTLQRLDAHCARGTYFHRLIAYPAPGEERNQLADTIRKLRQEFAAPGPKSARYELNVESVVDGIEATESSAGTSAMVYAAGRDNSPMSFPCLSFCSFQLDRDTVHMMAIYRSQYLIQRGYGNYLGLGRLLGYICRRTGLTPGQLTVVAGYAQLDVSKGRTARLLRGLRT